MKKIINLLFLLTFVACEFRPPSYQIQDYPINETRCNYPVTEIHNYNHSNTSTITECYYTSADNLKEELIFDGYSTELIGRITYEYKYSYYLKTIYDYLNGNQDEHYVVQQLLINKEL